MHVELGQRVVGGEERRHRLAVEQRRRLDARVLLGQLEDAEVQRAAAQAPDLLQAGQVRHLGARGGVAGVQRVEEPLQQLEREVRDAADPQPGAGAARPARLGDRPVQAREHRARLLGEDQPGLGGGHAAARALQQLDAQFVLEARMACESGGWRIDSRSAARPKCSSSMTARK